MYKSAQYNILHLAAEERWEQSLFRIYAKWWILTFSVSRQLQPFFSAMSHRSQVKYVFALRLFPTALTRRTRVYNISVSTWKHRYWRTVSAISIGQSFTAPTYDDIESRPTLVGMCSAATSKT